MIPESREDAAAVNGRVVFGEEQFRDSIDSLALWTEVFFCLAGHRFVTIGTIHGFSSQGQ